MPLKNTSDFIPDSIDVKYLKLTEEINYLEFYHMSDFRIVLKKIKDSDYHILYSGIHRLEAGKWVIVFYDNSSEKGGGK